MWNEEEFIKEFKNDNDNIKPSDDFKARLAAVVEAESNSKVIPFYRDVKKLTAIAAALAVLVIGGSVIGTNMLSSSSTSKSQASVNSDMSLEAGTTDSVSAAEEAAEDIADSDECADTSTNGGYQFEAEVIDVNQVASEIKEGAIVRRNGTKLDSNTANSFANILISSPMLEKAQKDADNLYEIDGSSTWMVEEYATGEMFIYAK